MFVACAKINSEICKRTAKALKTLLTYSIQMLVPRSMLVISLHQYNSYEEC